MCLSVLLGLKGTGMSCMEKTLSFSDTPATEGMTESGFRLRWNMLCGVGS